MNISRLISLTNNHNYFIYFKEIYLNLIVFCTEGKNYVFYPTSFAMTNKKPG